MPFILEAGNDSRPIEPGAAIVSVPGIGQVELHFDLAVGNLGLRGIGRQELPAARQTPYRRPSQGYSQLRSESRVSHVRIRPFVFIGIS